MAYNVFGNPVTNSTLEGMPEYAGKVITRRDRAHVALRLKNAENKDKNAREYVENLKKQWGTGVSTLCLVYNATGDPITQVTSKDWFGHIGPAPYPVTIANGQWGAFLHVKKTAAASGSMAAVVYRGMNNDGLGRDWMLAWQNPWSGRYNNTAYTEVRQSGYFVSSRWGNIYDQVTKAGLQTTATWGGCVSTVVTGRSTSPIYEGVLTLQGA